MNIFEGQQNPVRELIIALNGMYDDLEQNDPNFKYLTHIEQRELVLQKFGDKRKYYEWLWWPKLSKPIQLSKLNIPIGSGV